MNLRTLALAVALLAAFPLSGRTLDPAVQARLAVVGDVWGAAKFSHPYFGYRDIAWDAAAVRAVERVANGSDADLAPAIAEMLATIGDRATRVVAKCNDTIVAPAAIDEIAAGVPLISAASLLAAPARVEEALRTARGAVIDLRTGANECAATGALSKIESQLFAGVIQPLAERKLHHDGFRSQDGHDRDAYSSRFVIQDAAAISGARTSALAPLVIVVNERSELPPVVAALVRAHRARLIAVGGYIPDSHASRVTVAIDDSHHAVIRTGEPIANGAFATLAATRLPSDASEALVHAAALGEIAQRRRRAVAAPSVAAPELRERFDEPYAGMTTPAMPYRVLSAFRFWNAIRFFYGYPHLIEPFDRPRLAEMAGMMAAAETQRDYELALARFTTFVPDGHSRIDSPVLADLIGAAYAPFVLMPVEGKPVVHRLIDASGSAAGVTPGDELITIDGRGVEERIATLRTYISASYEEMLQYYVYFHVPRGAEGSTALFRFRRPDGSEYEASLKRSASYRGKQPPAWTILPENVAYLHPTYFVVADMQPFAQALAGTRGLIIDFRGYPSADFPGGALGSLLNKLRAARVAEIRIPQLVGGVRGEDYSVQERVLRDGTYDKPVVTMIDERAQSYSEHTCLMLEVVAGTTFVGSRTAGANGNITYLVLPGDIWVAFTGMDVRHGDGRQLQRIGIVPHVPVPRTKEALRAGRDEVMERALQLIP